MALKRASISVSPTMSRHHLTRWSGNTIEEQMPATQVSKWLLDTEEAATVVMKMKKLSDGSHYPSHVKVADFDDVSKDILVTAISLFRCLIVTKAPFPDSIADETMLGKDAWCEACQLKGVNIKLTPLAIKMVSRLLSMHSWTDLYYILPLESSWNAHHMCVVNSKRRCSHLLELSLAFGRVNWGTL